MKRGKQRETSLARVHDKRLLKVWKSNLVRSIRFKHSNLSSIAEYEQNDSLTYASEVDI